MIQPLEVRSVVGSTLSSSEICASAWLDSYTNFSSVDGIEISHKNRPAKTANPRATRSFLRFRIVLATMVIGLFYSLGCDGLECNDFPNHPHRLIEYYEAHQAETIKPSEPFLSQRKHLAGNWGGIRTAAAEQGISLTGSYANDIQGNPVGGRQQGAANASQFYWGITVDLHRFAGAWKGLSLYSSIVFRSGQDLSEKIGNAFFVAQLFGGSNLRLDELYLKMSLAKWDTSIKVGRLAAETDLIHIPALNYFVSLAIYGNPIAIFFDSPIPPDPFAVWGAYLETCPLRRLCLKLGFYQGNLRTRENRFHGLNFTLDLPQGAMIVSQAELSVGESFPGTYRVGGYYVTKGKRVLLGDRKLSTYAGFFLAEQVIWRRGEAQLSPWFMLLGTPSNRGAVPLFFGFGFIGKGLLCGRGDDILSLGFGYGKFSSRFQAGLGMKSGCAGAQGRANPRRSAETLVELNYWISVSPWMMLTPVLQWVGNPAGLGTTSDAFVVGMQVTAVL